MDLFIFMSLFLYVGFSVLLMANRVIDYLDDGPKNKKHNARMFLLAPLWPLWVLYLICKIIIDAI